MAERSMRCFARQTYRRLELMVVSEGHDEKRLLKQAAARPGIRARVISFRRGELSLGALRNVALREAGGVSVCPWDDDLYHPGRVQGQLLTTMAGDYYVSLLTDQLQLMGASMSVYWCDWSVTRVAAWRRPLPAPNTVIVRRRIREPYPDSGEHCHRAEDSELVRRLCRTRRVLKLPNLGYLPLCLARSEYVGIEASHRRDRDRGARRSGAHAPEGRVVARTGTV